MSKYEHLIDETATGLACLCFRNQAGLSLQEIKEIFSKHGNIVTVNCAGDRLGHRFVRFRTKEEALKCAIALDGSPGIRLQPVNKKNRQEFNENQRLNRFTRNKQENINEQKNNHIPHDNAEQTNKADSKKGSQSSRKSKTNNSHNRNRDDRVQNGLSSINNPNHTNGEIIEGNVNTEQFASNYENPVRKHLNSRLARNFPKTNKACDAKDEIQSPNNHMNTAKLAELHKVRGTIANTFHLPGNDPAVDVSMAGAIPQIISNPPSSHHSSRGQSAMNDTPPPLVVSVSSLQSGQANISEDKIEVVLACDVIVANIHANIGVSNIYHMLRKFSPIYVSDIETIPDINVRFCYVYFETSNDALGVEQSFDGVSVYGQNLITLRSHRLQVEAGIF